MIPVTRSRHPTSSYIHHCQWRGFQEKTEDINAWGNLDLTLREPTKQDRLYRQTVLRFKVIFSTQKHTCMCNTVLCLLVYHGTAVWSKSNVIQTTRSCATSSIYTEIRDHQKKLNTKVIRNTVTFQTLQNRIGLAYSFCHSQVGKGILDQLYWVVQIQS